MIEALLKTRNLRMRFADQLVLDGIDLHVKRGETVSIVGPSGAGKSTLLLLLAGLLKPSEGEIEFAGEKVNGPSRKRAVIFQSHALFPWLNALENVRFALADQSEAQARKYLRLVGLESVAELRPDQLSGGMQQRVGIARALAADPDLLLLDEPFASLDLVNRARLSEELLRLARELGKSLLLVTHNVDEALFLGDRVYVLSSAPGRVVSHLDTAERKSASILEFRAEDQFRTWERIVYESLFRSSYSSREHER